jgi:hypothetical protein
MNLDLFDSTNPAQTSPHVDDKGGHVTVTCKRQGSTHSGEPSYWNTTGMTGEALAEAIRTARHQDAAVLAVYQAASCPLTPWEVLHRCEAAGKRWPITSIRRSITTLANVGALKRLDTLRIGDLGRPEHEWEAA